MTDAKATQASLLPMNDCPLCECSAYLDYFTKRGGDDYYVRCSHCGLRLSSTKGIWTSEQAIAAWNTRPTSGGTEALRTALANIASRSCMRGGPPHQFEGPCDCDSCTARAALAKAEPASTEGLQNAHAVHSNMLLGTIAKLTPAQVAHLYSDSECAEIVAEIQRQRPASTEGREGWLTEAELNALAEEVYQDISVGNKRMFAIRKACRMALAALKAPASTGAGSLALAQAEMDRDAFYEDWLGLLEHHEAVEAAAQKVVEAYRDSLSTATCKERLAILERLTNLEGTPKPRFLKAPQPAPATGTDCEEE